MPAEQRVPVTAAHQSVDAILGLDFQYRSVWQVVEENAAFDLRLDNIPVDLVAKVDVGGKHRRDNANCIRHHYNSIKILVWRYILFPSLAARNLIHPRNV
jgi:hypothetical protein